MAVDCIGAEAAQDHLAALDLGKIAGHLNGSEIVGDAVANRAQHLWPYDRLGEFPPSTVRGLKLGTMGWIGSGAHPARSPKSPTVVYPLNRIAYTEDGMVAATAAARVSKSYATLVSPVPGRTAATPSVVTAR